MATVKVVCDASYDDQLRLTGYAGGVYVSEQQRGVATYMYQGVAGELKNIQEGELTAILVGLRELKRRAQASGLKIDGVEIYTDSKSSVLLLNNLNAVPDSNIPLSHGISTPKQAELFDKIQSICDGEQWQPSIHHVNAHVNPNSATGIEKLNQIADERAAYVRRAAWEEMLNPPIQGSPYVAVLLPDKAKSPEEAKLLKVFANELAKQGKKCRLYIDGNPTTHPFIEGLSYYAKKNNIPEDELATIYQHNPQYTHYGMDMLLYRHHVSERLRGPPLELQHNSTEARAALVSRLLYGDPMAEPFNMERATGRIQPPSSAVYDLMDPFNSKYNVRPDTVQGWTSIFLDSVSIPLKRGLKGALLHVGITPPSNMPERSEQQKMALPSSVVSEKPSRLFSQLEAAYRQYKDQLEPPQLAHKLIEVLTNNGSPSSQLFHNAMERFIRTTPKKDECLFLNRVIRQSEKLDPQTTPAQRATRRESDISLDQEHSFRRR